jgi:hypothetical protein
MYFPNRHVVLQKIMTPDFLNHTLQRVELPETSFFILFFLLLVSKKKKTIGHK